MLPTTLVNPTANKSPLVTQGPPDSKAPETGEFDFLDYLLGLQDTDIETMAAGDKAKTELVPTDSKPKTGKNAPGINLAGLMPQPTLPTPLNPLISGKTEVKDSLADKTAKAILGKESIGKEGKDALTAPLALTSLPIKHPISDGKITVGDLKPQVKQEPVVAEATVRDKAIQKYSQVANATHEGEKAQIAKATTTAAAVSVPIALVATGASSAIVPHEKNEKQSGKKGDEKLSSLESLIQAGQSRPESTIAGQTDVHHVEMAAGERSTVPELFNRVNTLVQQGGGKMTVSLNPPHLGQVEVQVTARGKKIEIEMKSESTHAKSLLETHAADLKQSLQTHDLVLSKMEVQVNRDFVPQSAKFAGMMNQDNSQNSSGSFSGDDRSRSNQSYHETPAVVRARTEFALAGGRGGALGNGRVDLRI